MNGTAAIPDSPNAHHDLVCDVIEALIDHGYKADRARVVAELAQGDKFSDLFRDALNRLSKDPHRIRSQPSNGTSPVKPCQCAPGCTAVPKPGKQYAWGHKPKNGPSQPPPGIPTQPQMAVPAGLPHKPTSNAFQQVSAEEFRRTFTRGGLVFDDWTREVIAQIMALPVGGHGVVTLPEGKSSGGLRDTVGRAFSREKYRVRVFATKKDKRLLGIAKVPREAAQ